MLENAFLEVSLMRLLLSLDVGLFLSIRLREKRILRAHAKKMFIWELFH